jgi:hypothetical protein
MTETLAGCFITVERHTRARKESVSLEDVQRAAGHVDPGITKLYDRRGYNPEKSASFFANY